MGDDSFGGGGGIYSYGNVTLTSSTVSENSTTSGNGGGISSFIGSCHAHEQHRQRKQHDERQRRWDSVLWRRHAHRQHGQRQQYDRRH